VRKRSTLITVGAITAVVVMMLGIGGAAACKLTDLNCHLRPASGWQLSEAKGNLGGARSISADLSARRIVKGLDYPTDFDFLPNGQMIVALRNGLIERVDRDGRVFPKPVLDLRNRVNISGLRGLMAVAVDPSPTLPLHFYVSYSVIDPAHPSATSDKPTTVRVSRFTMVNGVASPRSEQVIEGRVAGGSCVDRPTTNCIPADADHIGADIVFLPDHTLLISTGDGGPALGNVELAQRTDSLGGKILRVDRSGRGLPTNPFWNGDPDANQSKVWAYGFRNPFRLSFFPDGDVVVGDVGYNSVEELDVVKKGAEYGWPCLEGAKQTPEFRSTSFCRDYYARHPHRSVAPWFALPQPRWQTVIAGTSLERARELPESFRTQYAFADWAISKVWVTDVATKHRHFVSKAGFHLVESGAAGPVRLRVGSDGALYELSINTGELWRFTAHSH
jgi:glucose/arabinose dehydrogenase